MEEKDSNDSDARDKLEKMLEDEQGTEKKLRDYIYWHVKKAGGKTLKEDKKRTEFDNYLNALIYICQSGAWRPKFRTNLEIYPDYQSGSDEKNSQRERCSGNTRPPACGNCQACIRPWSVKVTLDGKPYDKITYAVISRSDVKPVVYYIGSACHERSELYHDLYHFGHALYDKCKEKVVESMDEKKIVKVLLDTMYKDWKRLMAQTKKYCGK